MTISDVTGLKASVVLLNLRLLPSDSEFERFRESLGREVVKQAAQTIVLGPGGIPQVPSSREEDFELRLDQERISIRVGPRGTEIEQEYAGGGLVELSTIVVSCIENSFLGDSTPSAFGYNLEVRCDQGSGIETSRYLSESLLQPGLIPWGHPEGLSFTLVVHEDATQWTFTLEPRLREKGTHALFAKANYHFDEMRVPSPEEIRDSLGLLWSRTVELLEGIDGRVRS